MNADTITSKQMIENIFIPKQCWPKKSGDKFIAMIGEDEISMPGIPKKYFESQQEAIEYAENIKNIILER